MPSQATGAARIGRRIGIGVFWLMALFVTGMSTWSVVTEIYGGRGDATVEQQRVCAENLRDLELDLREIAANEVRLPRDADRYQRWIADWDDRYAKIEACGELEDARQALGDLRARTAAMLQQHTRRSAPLTERIERALDRIDPRPASRPPKET